ncbi:putative Gut-specific cysteine proteinase [Blattamonas nauphoetae]|uniref:Gut-specific cysteine proteinase n=1 Tax=Blattamonas nauphoetae TaxID=2049346 RepID=A0ABQ9XSG7_9EUKA|nr:putative Gut-specific cysteine proteinase [Blattamonas nauphoetae]
MILSFWLSISSSMILMCHDSPNAQFRSLCNIGGKDSQDDVEEFDSRLRWPGLISEPRNPGLCNGVYAFAAASMASDRLAIQGVANMIVSPQHFLSCGLTCHGCNPCDATDVDLHISRVGVVSESCFPYISERGRVPQCPLTCQDGSNMTGIKAIHSYPVFSIRKEVYNSGPVMMSLKNYPSFTRYRSGIYAPAKGEKDLGLMPVSVVGWGTDPTAGKFYIVKCNLGTGFGEGGYARVVENLLIDLTALAVHFA